MLPKLSYTQKNKLLLPVLVVGLLLCWFLAFDKTYEAFQLRQKLEQESQQSSDLSFNPSYVQRKRSALDAILKGYQVKPQWNDQLWMASSAIASKNGVSVDFTLNKPSADSADSTSVGQSQTLYFHGRFAYLVKLVDTLEGLKGIGKISGLKLKGPKVVDEAGSKIELKLDFKGLER